MTSTGKGKAGHFTHSRTDRCRPDVVGVAGLQYLTFFVRLKLLSVMCIA